MKKYDNSKDIMDWMNLIITSLESRPVFSFNMLQQKCIIFLIGVGVLSYIPYKHCDILSDHHRHLHYYHKVHLLTCLFSSYLASITIQSSDLRISYYLASMVTFSPAIIWSTA